MKRRFGAARKAVQPTVGVAGYSLTSLLSGAPLPSVWALLVVGLACAIPETVEKIVYLLLGAMVIRRFPKKSDAKDFAMFRELFERSRGD